MGRERIERLRSSVLGRKVWDRPIDVTRSQSIRFVIPEVDPSTLNWHFFRLVWSTNFSPAGNLLATGSNDCRVRICK